MHSFACAIVHHPPVGDAKAGNEHHPTGLRIQRVLQAFVDKYMPLNLTTWQCQEASILYHHKLLYTNNTKSVHHPELERRKLAIRGHELSLWTWLLDNAKKPQYSHVTNFGFMRFAHGKSRYTRSRLCRNPARGLRPKFLDPTYYTRNSLPRGAQKSYYSFISPRN